jgi:rare lipoprotein A
MDTKTGDDIECRADIGAAVNGEQGDLIPSREPSREPAALISVIAAATLSLMGIAGIATPADASVAPTDAALPPPEAAKSARSKSPRRISPDVKPNIDRSGRKRFGKASFYARMFAGRKMADGTPMRPTGDNAASLTLPLGTTAQVTNLETGKTAVVTIRDRGPYVDGRIVDLSPATARRIGLDHKTGVTEVEVAPIVVPLPDGKLKLGDGALEANNITVTANVR